MEVTLNQAAIDGLKAVSENGNLELLVTFVELLCADAAAVAISQIFVEVNLALEREFEAGVSIGRQTLTDAILESSPRARAIIQQALRIAQNRVPSQQSHFIATMDGPNQVVVSMDILHYQMGKEVAK
jgi:hypothetical protein